jgi:hypothetical protein
MPQSEIPDQGTQGCGPQLPLDEPNGLEVYQWFDSFIDAFNGLHDKGPKDHPLYYHRARWRRERKYACEDIDDAIFLYHKLCEHLELQPGQARAYSGQLNQALLLLAETDSRPDARSYWPALGREIARALESDPGHPMAVARRFLAVPLWLRAALQVDPTLPPPLPAWPLLLTENLERARANFTGGSESWCRSDHEDATFAQECIPKALERLGWFDPSRSRADGAAKARMEAADEALMDKAGFHKIKAEELEEWLYDPLEGKWFRHKDIKDSFFSWDRKTRVISTKGSWTMEEVLRAAALAQKGIPPMPSVPLG